MQVLVNMRGGMGKKSRKKKEKNPFEAIKKDELMEQFGCAI